MEWDRSSLPFRSAGRRSLASWSLLFGRDGAQLGGLRLVHRAVVVDCDAVVASCRLGRDYTPARLAGAARILAVLLLPHHDRRDRLVDLDRHVAHAAREGGGR